MRMAIIALTVAGALTASLSAASAADGCSYDGYGRLYCAPGAQPGVPYYGPGGYGYGYGGNRYYGDGGYYRHRDTGAAIALGIAGIAAAAIAQGSRRHYRYRRHR